jgi:hypothetical protein
MTETMPQKLSVKRMLGPDILSSTGIEISDPMPDHAIML